MTLKLWPAVVVWPAALAALLLACLLLTWPLLAAEKAANDAAPALGRAIENFTLRDFRGVEHSLTAGNSAKADSKLTVVTFLGCECPIAKLSAPRLAALAKEFGPQGVAFLAIDSNSQDSLTELAAFAKEHHLEFPLLKDLGNTVADQFAAQRTPEVFVLDAQRQVRYHGRVDDQYLVGKQRPRPTRDDLKIALEELLAGKAVTTPETPLAGCHIGRVPERRQAGNITYSEHIAPLLDKHCVSCHRPGEVAPFPLTSYEDVVGWGETIREIVHAGKMPPWLANPEHGHFANDTRLSDAEKKLIYGWLDEGAPEGDPALRPAARTFTSGWQIPEPEQVLYASEQPIDVPAEGTVRYQHFLIDPGFKEDRWIRAAELRPGNRSVVHHIVVNFIPPGAKPRIGLNGPMIGFAPGIPPVRLPKGLAMFVPAGSKILFQLHYTPNGSPQQDRSSLGLVFADPAEVHERVAGDGAANVRFELPPGADDVEVRSEHRFNQPTRLVSLMPHMHLRGKSFRYELEYADGNREILLDVPHYDFAWQLRYELAEPKLIPAGTTLLCTAHFDNSARNAANPDPSARVRWGEQTWDEMMIGYFGTVSDRAATSAAGASALKVRDDDEGRQRARQAIERGLEALGGQQRLAGHPVLSFKTKGKLYIASAPVEFTGLTMFDQAASKMRIEVDGAGLKAAIVLDSDQGWFRFGERLIDMPREVVDEYRERTHAEGLALLYPLLADELYQLAWIEDAKLGERPVEGVRVRHEGHRDVRLLFDPQTHLLVKSECTITESGRDLTQEMLLEDYVEVDGLRHPGKITTRWDGSDRAIRAISDYRLLDAAPADAFAKP